MATKCTRSGGTPASAIDSAYCVDRGEGPAQRVGMELPGRVDALTEPDDLGPAIEIDQPAVGSRLGDQQADRVGAAVDGGDASS